MKIILQLLMLTVVISFMACDGKEYVEPDPVVSTVLIDGHEFFIEGTIDGTAFRISHTNGFERNIPSTQSRSTAQKLFTTTFSVDSEGRKAGLPSIINFGITAPQDKSLEEMLEPRAYTGFYDFSSNLSEGEVLVENVLWEDEFYTNDLFAESNPFNQFNITGVELLNDDPNIDPAYNGKMYKVEGRFQVMIDDWRGNKFPLVIDKFSALFVAD